MAPSDGLLGVGLTIAPRPVTARSFRLSWQICPGTPTDVTPARQADLGLVAGNAMAPCIPLLAALAQGRGQVALGLGPELLLRLGVSSSEP